MDNTTKRCKYDQNNEKKYAGGRDHPGSTFQSGQGRRSNDCSARICRLASTDDDDDDFD